MASWQGNKWPDNQHYSDPSQRRNKNKKKKNHYLLQTGLFCDVACDKEIHISETRGGRKERKNGRRDERQSDILSKTVMTTFQVTVLFILQIAPFLRCF